ncbi:DUF406 family protein [Candidatus Enterovibrio escicola]|uniref:DUF406 family protein n=1 Tax=Candidatus Enterovibrio escicola TaxID=1927127 RepID=UPI0012381AFF|nr:DUF406 family protein [Candidatus Enterovibrio escacola]
MNQKTNQIDDGCDVTTQMGYLIREGNDTIEVNIIEKDKKVAMAKFQSYLTMAREVNANVDYILDKDVKHLENKLTLRLKFECSAEKLIFELLTRSQLK